jgi:hypothetical protein
MVADWNGSGVHRAVLGHVATIGATMAFTSEAEPVGTLAILESKT